MSLPFALNLFEEAQVCEDPRVALKMCESIDHPDPFLQSQLKQFRNNCKDKILHEDSGANKEDNIYSHRNSLSSMESDVMYPLFRAESNVSAGSQGTFQMVQFSSSKGNSQANSLQGSPPMQKQRIEMMESQGVLNSAAKDDAMIATAFDEILALPSVFVFSKLALPSSSVFMSRCETWQSLLSVQARNLSIPTYISANKLTLLMILSSLGNVDLIDAYLCFFGNDYINFQNSEGNSAIHCAAYHGHLAACQKLLQHGANCFLFNKFQERPLNLAVKANHMVIANYFENFILHHKPIPAPPSLIYPISQSSMTPHRNIIPNSNFSVFHPSRSSRSSSNSSPCQFDLEEEPIISGFGIAKLATFLESQMISTSH